MKNATIVRFKADTDEYNRKVKQAKSTLQEFGLGGKQAGQAIGQLDKLLGTSIGTLGKLSIGIGAVSAALKVAKDAFFRSESNIDAWGSTIKQASAAYNVFLDSLTSGNWNNFFQNLNTAIEGADKLYKALDRLGSIKQNNAAAIAISQSALQELRLKKQQGVTTVGGRNIDDLIKEEASKLAGLRSQSVTAGKNAGLRMSAEEIRNRYNADGGNNLSYSSAQAAALDIMKNGQSAMDKYARRYNSLLAKGMEEKQYSRSNGFGGTEYYTAREFNINNLSKEEQKQYLLAKAITEGETTIKEGIAIYAQAVTENAQAAKEELRANAYAKAGSGGKAPKELITRSSTLGLSGLGKQNVSLPSAKVGNIFTAPQSFQDYWFSQAAQEKLQEIEAKEAAEKIDKLKSTWLGVGSAIQSAASNLAQFASTSEEAATAAKTMTIAASIATLVGQFAAIPKGKEIWSWIAGTVAGTATLLSTIASLKSVTEYHAQGGWVGNGGIKRGTDTVPAMLTPGEIVLSKSMQSNLANNLQGGLGNLQLTTRVSAEDIVFVLNSNNARRGRGNFVTSHG